MTAIKELFGNVIGLKPSQKKRLSTLYRRKLARQAMAPQHFLRALTELSHEIERQVGVLVDRKGEVTSVIVGDAHQIVIPAQGRIREAHGRLRGLRLIHTHLQNEPLSKDDLNDLSHLRFDFMMAVGVTEDGFPGHIYYAYLLPENAAGDLWKTEGPHTAAELEKDDFQFWIRTLEDEFARAATLGSEVADGNRAILVGVYPSKKFDIDARMGELEELANSAGLYVMGRVIQRRPKPDHRFLLGQGKLEDLILRSMQQGVDILVFDSDLSPGQSRNIADVTELKILDRTQLILDIFAQRAHSRDGKLQVELAQLKYMLPRLNRMNKAMSRLTGGIGGRGPGETKLEINRRRARERISRLEKQLKQVKTRRQVRRSKRKNHNVPIISAVGYTNAGKSTLVNTLTHSEVVAENRMFSTLDPVSRRLRFPEEREVILTDTVGFIRDLPPELKAAFEATLEELEDANLLLQVVDISDSSFTKQIEAVDGILRELELHQLPRLLILNKIDKIPKEEAENLCRTHDAIGVSALDRETLRPLLEVIEMRLWNHNRSVDRGYETQVEDADTDTVIE